MRFKDYIKLNEWFTTNPKEKDSLENSLNVLNSLITTKKFVDAETLFQNIWKRVFNVLKYAEKENMTSEINYTKEILNNLHALNLKTSGIRNVKTQSF